ncbi:hypothetical protein [Ktedonobacter robiniae]|uniref:Uncharacterized protein n=1 Tax=Ktedonobacter robiniae TaxID=2778365 RepID=A0ABQ3UNZ4_9CHLR|nr:hypothetical protein [Ktedonobacter robiniae]GHO54382.1 hypothetical protein KSB_28570 [Ktedonobacter robiniae]
MQSQQKDRNACILNTLSISELADACKREFDMVGDSGAVSFDNASLALLRLATIRDSKQAWLALEYGFCQKLVICLRQHPRFQEALRLQSEQEYITRAFAHFRQTTVSKQMEFASLNAALRCLAVSLNSVIFDMLRSAQQSTREPQQVFSSPAEIWRVLSQKLTEERERRLAYLLFQCGLKPTEIVEHCAHEFRDLAEVQRLRINILDRLAAISLC